MFQEIVPLYFRQSRLSSFKRQLNLVSGSLCLGKRSYCSCANACILLQYGFELISNGPSRGAYFHELFQRDKPNLSRRMRRVAVKVAKKEEEDQDQSATEGATAEEDLG